MWSKGRSCSPGCEDERGQLAEGGWHPEQGTGCRWHGAAWPPFPGPHPCLRKTSRWPDWVASKGPASPDGHCPCLAGQEIGPGAGPWRNTVRHLRGESRVDGPPGTLPGPAQRGHGGGIGVQSTGGRGTAVRSACPPRSARPPLTGGRGATHADSVTPSRSREPRGEGRLKPQPDPRSRGILHVKHLTVPPQSPSHCHVPPPRRAVPGPGLGVG